MRREGRYKVAPLGDLRSRINAAPRMRAGPGDRNRYLCPVRRIERVAAPPEGRFVALVFEDGPTAAPPRPRPSRGRWTGNGITELILDVLEAYGGAATFAVVGSTAGNYADQKGPPGSPQWNGVAYDHFPEYGQDVLAGVAAQPDLVRRMIEARHELANHSWRHIVFGPHGPAHHKRGHHAGYAAALGDLSELQDYMHEQFGYQVRLARPPHLVDEAAPTPAGTAGGRDAYDALASLGCDYLGLGVDGGGWAASSGSYDNDVDRMVLGLQRPLEKDGAVLSGALLSQKDGFNHTGQSPVVTALPRLMQLFRNYGYKTVTVSDLLEMSPFADIGADHPVFAAAKELLRRGWWVAYPNNTVRPDAPVLRGELAVWAMGSAKPDPVTGTAAGLAIYSDSPAGHPYRWQIETATARGYWRGVKGSSGRPSDPGARGSRVFGVWDPVSPEELREVMGRAGVTLGDRPEELAPPAEEEMPSGGLNHAQALAMMAARLA